MIFILLSFVNGYAKTAVAVVHDTIHVANNTKELELYKMLYQNAKDNSLANYTMLYTIIAIVVGFIIFILGSQAFFNYRINQRDLENLKAELTLNYTTNLGDLRSDFQKLEVNLKADISEKTTKLGERVGKLHDSLDVRIDVVNSSLNELMANEYKNKGSNQAALIHFVWSCRSSLDAGLKTTLDSALERLRDFLTTISEVSDYSEKNIKELLESVLVKYPDFANVVDEIKNELQKKTIIAIKE